MDEENKFEQNETKKTKKKKEKKPATLGDIVIKRIIFLLIFFIIAIIVLAFLLARDRDKKRSENNYAVDTVQEEEKKRAKHQGLIDLDKDTYNLNDLKITECEEEYQGLKISYCQIDGLLDNSIEASINYNLKNDVELVVTQALKDNKINKEEFYSYCDVISSFANTMSIRYYISSSVYNKLTEEWEYPLLETISENYDLTTGNRIKLKDIFTDDTVAADIFGSEFYSELVPSYTTIDSTDYEYDWTEKVVDYNDIEEEILLIASKFNNGENIDFVFDEQKITLLDYWASVYYEDCLDTVAIYNRYRTGKSIFDGKYKTLDNLPVLVKRAYTDFQKVEQGENYYIDVTLKKSMENENSEVYEKALEHVKNEIYEIKQKAKNSNKFIVANYYYDLNAKGFWDSELQQFFEYGTYELYYSKCTYETTKSFFNSKLYDAIIGVYRHAQRVETGEAYLYDNLFIYYLGEIIDYDEYDRDYGEKYFDSYGNMFDTEEEMNNYMYGGFED